MCSQNTKKKKVTKGNTNWEQGSMLFKVLKGFSLGKNHLLYLYKTVVLHSLPQISPPLFVDGVSCGLG